MDPSESVNHALAVLEQKRHEKLAVTKAQLGPLGQLALDLLERSRSLVDAGGGLARALGGRLDNRMGECWTLRMGERTDLVLTVEQCIVVYDLAERSKVRDARALREAIVQAGIANRLRTSGTIRVLTAAGVGVDRAAIDPVVVVKPRGPGPTQSMNRSLLDFYFDKRGAYTPVFLDYVRDSLPPTAGLGVVGLLGRVDG